MVTYVLEELRFMIVPARQVAMMANSNLQRKIQIEKQRSPKLTSLLR
jgi:hypothetical protein